METGGNITAHWSERLQIDECDRHLLASYRLEYKKGAGNYWKVLAVPRGARNHERKYTAFARLILAAPAHMLVDHISGDTLDNRRCNLRLCTPRQNMFNRASPVGGFKGACWIKGAWHSQINQNGKCRGLGRFDTEEAAARAYDRAALELHGEFARLNFPVAREV